MKVIVGLGNPGQEYARTRHNVGFLAVEMMATRLQAPSFSFKPKFNAEVSKHADLLLIKPQTYMNHSGQAVRAVLEYFTSWQPGDELDWLSVIHDDLDIPVGQTKRQFGIGPKQHNGLLSLYEHLGTKAFWHCRVGIDGRMGDRTVPPEQYVLQMPSVTEQQLITSSMESMINQMVSTF